MTVPAYCDCGRRFDVDESLVGGLTNCPGCGKVVEVEGLRDPWWRVLQVLAFVLWIGAIVVAYQVKGPEAALTAGVALALLMWLASKGF